MTGKSKRPASRSSASTAKGKLEARIAELEKTVAEQLDSLKKLQEREKLNRFVFENAREAFILIDATGLIVDWNSQAERLFGWKKAEVLGEGLSETILPSRFRKIFKDDLKRFSDTEGAHFINNRVDMAAIKRDQKEFPANIAIFPLALGDKITMCAFVLDKTERARVQLRRAAQYELTRVLAESVSVEEAGSKILQTIAEATNWETGLIWLVDKEIEALKLLDTWQNPRSLADSLERASRWRQFRLSEGLPGRVWQTHMPIWIDDIVSDESSVRAQAALADGLHGALALPVSFNDEILGVIEFFSKDLRPPDPDLLAWLTAIGSQIGQFIERKRSESSRRQLAAIVESSHDAVIGANLDGRITNWNVGAERIYGLTPEQAIGQNLLHLMPEDQQPEFNIMIARAREGRRSDEYETVRRTPAGKALYVSLSIAPVFDANGRVLSLAVIGHEVTERKERETQIKNLNQDLEAQVLKLAVLNAELKSLSQSLARARDQAVEASGIKSQFLANMSHEIRTPMNAIIGMSDLLLHTNLSREQFEFTQMIRESAGNLLDIVNDILDFSKIEAGKLRLELCEFDLVSLLEGAAELLADKANQKSLSLMTFISPAIPRIVRGDQGRLRQIVLNLLSNAIKFTESGTIVLEANLLSGDETLATVEIAVKDTGIGITPEALQQIFHPFTQADNSISRKFGGTGLGLSISKRLVELMGGEIWAESNETEGSVFSFSLSFEVSSPKESEPRPVDLSGARLLIVANQQETARIISSYCRAWGIKCDTTGSGAGALSMMRSAAARQEHYDIVIVEKVLPDTDALSFASQVIGPEHRDLQNSRLVLFTQGGPPPSDCEHDPLLKPFSAYLTSPLRQSVLFDCIANLSGKSLAGEGIRPSLLKSRNLDEPKYFEGVQAPGQSRPERLILLAEDNPVNQKVALLQLRKLGYTARAVSNGKEALEALARESYALVLMDCQMPVMDGYQATSAIRKAETMTGRHIPIIAMTAHAMAGDREKCIAEGMDDYISKPVDPKLLTRVLEKWLSKLETEGRQPGTMAARPESEAGQSRTPVDLDLFKAMCGTSDPTEMVDPFVRDIEMRIKRCSESIQSHDMIAIKSAAYEMTQALASAGAMEMRDLSRQLEFVALEKNWTQCKILLEALNQCFLKLRSYLDESSTFARI